MSNYKRFEKLLEPYHIGQVKTRNRIIKTGAGLLMWHEDDLHMREEVKAFYEAIARGGVGLLIVEAPTVDYPLGARWRERYRIDHDKYIKGLSELVEVIHRHGCPTFMQMNHDGPWQVKMHFVPAPLFDGPPVAASPVKLDSENDHHNELPRALTIPEIEEIIDKFASAAVRAQKAGFDGVDINAGSSHLLHNFLSPFWNRRQDAYGGNLENRTRLLVQIIREIKKRAGQDFPVSVIINGIEIGRAVGIDDKKCLTAQESQQIAQLLERAGADAIQVRSHWLGYHVGSFLPDVLFYPEPPVPLKDFPKEYDWRHRGKGANLPLAARIKKVVSVPVIAVGRLDPELGEKALREGKADFIGMTRRLLADPELPNKIAAGRTEDIAPCTACTNCLGLRRCRVNTFLWTQKNTTERAERRKRVLVIGGGPAGMEAARVAALRGHEVALFEKTHKLGGLLPLATLVKGTHPEDLPNLVRYLETQVNKLGVKIRLGKEVKDPVVEKIRPDVAIVATGGIPVVPEIEGIDKRNVIGSAKLHRMLKFYLRFVGPRTLGWLTKFFMPIGKRVVIIGGGIQGCELAEFLVKRGRKVTIVDTTEILGEGIVESLRMLLFEWFNKKGVTMVSGVKNYLEITDEGLTIVDREGERKTFQADNILIALPLKANTAVLQNVKGKIPEVYAIGDCREPGLIADAIADGAHIAQAI